MLPFHRFESLVLDWNVSSTYFIVWQHFDILNNNAFPLEPKSAFFIGVTNRQSHLPVELETRFALATIQLCDMWCGKQSIRWNRDKNLIEMTMRNLLGYSHNLYTDFEDRLADVEFPLSLVMKLAVLIPCMAC